MSTNKSAEIFNTVMNNALKFPAVKVDREAFLRNAFSEYCTKEQLTQIIKQNPRAILEIDLLAKNVIKVARLEVTAVSAATGVAGNPFAVAGLAVADMAQYVCFCLNLCQKLAYIYGFPDLMEDGKLTPNSVNILTPFLAVMFGVSGSKFIPALGALISGTITYAAFGPSANKLAEKLRYNSDFFKDVIKTAEEFDEDAEFEEFI